MELKTILDNLGVPVSTGIILILISFIKIPKIEINIWQVIGKALSKGLTSNLIEELQSIKNDIGLVDRKVNSLGEKLDGHIEKYEEDLILANRQHILRFNDEIIQGVKHTQEHFDEILSEIDKYEDYCTDHPRFPNNKCVLACRNIKSVYVERLERNDFLTPGNKGKKRIKDD